MRPFWLRGGIIIVTVWLTALMIPGMTIQGGVMGIVLISLVFALVNATIKPVFKWLVSPLIVLTLGLFTLVVNMLMLLLVEWLVPQYLDINGWFTAFIAAILISVIGTIINLFIPDWI